MNFNESMRDAGRMTIAQQVAALGGPGRLRKDGTGGGTRKLAEARAAITGNKVKSEEKAIQRALRSGRSAPAKDAPAVADAGAQRVAAERMRNASALSVGTGGKVPVVSKSSGKPRGNLHVSVLMLDDQARRELAQAAADFESGNVREAEQQLSQTIVGLHAKSRGDNRNAADYIEIENFDGLTFT